MKTKIIVTVYEVNEYLYQNLTKHAQKVKLNI